MPQTIIPLDEVTLDRLTCCFEAIDVGEIYKARVRSIVEPLLPTDAQSFRVVLNQKSLIVNPDDALFLGISINGVEITATWRNIPTPTPNDWVGLFRVNSPGSFNKHAWRYTGGGPAGSAKLLALTTPAKYQVRMYANDSLDRPMVVSTAFDVGA